MIGLGDRLVVAVLLQPAHEALVDLHALQRQAREIGERRVAGAEVVHGDGHAHLLQPHQRRDRALGVRDDHALGDLEVEVVGRQPGGGERLLDDRQPALVLQLLHREVDRQAQEHVLPVPLHDLAARVAQHARAQRLDHPRLLGDGDELGGRHHAALRIAPAQQRLDAAGPPAAKVDLRLVDEEELVVHQPPAHVGLELQPLLHARVHVRGVEAICVAAGLLRRVHRGVRLLDQRHRVHGVQRVDRHADRARERGRLVGEAERRLERVADPLQHGHDFEGRMRRVEAGQDHHELVATQSRDGVRFAHRVGEALRDRTCRSWSPASWPSVSLMRLKWSRSRNRQATCRRCAAPARRSRAGAG